jgi:hypothetical protein
MIKLENIDNIKQNETNTINLLSIIFLLLIGLEIVINSVPSSIGSLNIATANTEQKQATIIIALGLISKIWLFQINM